jgi:hypothetical protein
MRGWAAATAGGARPGGVNDNRRCVVMTQAVRGGAANDVSRASRDQQQFCLMRTTVTAVTVAGMMGASGDGSGGSEMVGPLRGTAEEP